MQANFMIWVDLLPEVAALVRHERDKLAAQMADAHRLELRATALRLSVQEGRAMLRDRVIRHWVMRDIEQAAADAAREGGSLPPGFVDDSELRAALLALDEAAEPAEMLLALNTVHVLRTRSVFRVGDAPDGAPGSPQGQPPSA